MPENPILKALEAVTELLERTHSPCQDLAGFLDDPEIYKRIKRWKNGKEV